MKLCRCKVDQDVLWEMYGAPEGSDDWELARKLAGNCHLCNSEMGKRSHDKLADLGEL